jgi:hypothetical protein
LNNAWRCRFGHIGFLFKEPLVKLRANEVTNSNCAKTQSA